MAHLDLQTGTYAAAETLLGSRQSRRIGHNTTLHRYSGPADIDRLCVRYHSTDIVEFDRAGWLTINTGGWDTVTTWQRINALLPGPWRIASDGKRGRWLYRSGRPITPYADGLSIHVGFSSGSGSGAIGMHGETLLTAAQVDAIAEAADAAAQVRAEKRAARLLREHPAVRTVTYRADIAHARNGYAYGVSSPLPTLHRGYRAQMDCDRCRAEADAWKAIRRETLTADHDAGHGWTVTVNGGTISEPAGACPWDCPLRTGIPAYY